MKTFEEQLNKETIMLYPRGEVELKYYDVRLKNDDGTPSIYKAVGDYWELKCVDDYNNDYIVLVEYDPNRLDFDEYDYDEVFVVLKDVTGCDDYRVCALWVVDDPINYEIDYDCWK